MGVDSQAAGHVGDNVFIACPGSSADLGLWGSLVYPSGFGTPPRGRRACDGSSNLPSPTTIVIEIDSARHPQTARLHERALHFWFRVKKRRRGRNRCTP